MPSKLLAIYLNDHLTGATGGAALARRTAESNQLEQIEACRRRAAGEALIA